MTQQLPEGTVTVLFTDVVGSTDLTTRQGDEAAPPEIPSGPPAYLAAPIVRLGQADVNGVCPCSGVLQSRRPAAGSA